MKFHGQLHTTTALPLEEELLVQTGQRSQWAWELIWIEWQRKRIPCPCKQSNPGHPSHSLC